MFEPEPFFETPDALESFDSYETAFNFLAETASADSDDEEFLDSELSEEELYEAGGFHPKPVESPGGQRIQDKTPPNRSDLVTVAGYGGKKQLHRFAAEAWQALVNAARAEGLKSPLLLVVSGYRDPARQRRLWEAALQKYGSPQKARKWVAPPGGSAHQTGRAIDFYLGGKNSSANVAMLRNTPAYRWLVANAQRFGFYPYPDEPWHWEYNPPATQSSEVPWLGESETLWQSEFDAVSDPSLIGRNGSRPAETLTAIDPDSWTGSELGEAAPVSGRSIFQRLQEALVNGAWSVAIRLAILSGNRDENSLTNMIFFFRHPERNRRPIQPHETQFAQEWRKIRDQLVKPALQAMGRTVPPTTGGMSGFVVSPQLALLLNRIRSAPKTYVLPRTEREIVDNYERAKPRGDVWCRLAGLSLDEGALARMVASEVGNLPPQYMIAVIEATINEAGSKNISVFQRITMQGLKLKGGVIPKSAGFFGRRSGRWCSSIQDPTLQHLEAVRVVLITPRPLVALDARRWVDGRTMDRGLQGGKKLAYNAVTIVQKWGAEGWEWIGPVFHSDGRTPLLDPYLLMMFRFVGPRKANIQSGVGAMIDGRRRWKIAAV
jgi:D-alanyl-D-alanine dipeptidase